MSGHLIDDSPLTSFHKKLALYSSGGPFIDGYALTIVGVALITLEPAVSLSSTEIGLIGAASLVGVFVGGMFFGYLTDRIGRQFMYIADLIALALFSILLAFTPVRPGSLSSLASCSRGDRCRLPDRHLAAGRVLTEEVPRLPVGRHVRGLGDSATGRRTLHHSKIHGFI
jgi:MFS family permease